MPYKNPEERKQYRKTYYDTHRDKAIEEAKKWKQEHREHVNEQARTSLRERLRSDETFHQHRNALSRNYYQKHREKRLMERHAASRDKELARQAVRNAVRQGILIKPDYCEQCLMPHKRLHAHHADYNIPLVITWLCPFCHGRVHQSA